MFLEIITPDRKLFSGEVLSVTVPGASGQFTILNNHAPIISTLLNGKVKVKSSTGTQAFDLKSGVVEVLKNRITVLAESA